jgi:hypothetical protein
MSTHRLIRFTLVPLAASVLLTALVLLTAEASPPVAAADAPDWQQLRGPRSITSTMPMTAAMPAMMGQMMEQMQQMQTMMGQMMPMTSTMPMHQPGMGMRMEMMGRMMQMMGMMHDMMHPTTMPMTRTMPMAAPHMGRMMQMMGMMMQMTGMMHELSSHNMPMTGTMPMGRGMDMGMMDMMPMMQMMQQMMGQMVPMSGTLPMTPTMPMGAGMQPDMMQMMGQMMQMMNAMHGRMGGTMTMTNTAPVSGTTGAAPTAQTQTAQVGAVEIKVTPTNLQATAADTLDFAVELNSHSAEIDLDLAESARLLVGDDELTPVAWQAATPRGHHVAGVLRFARTDDEEETVLDEATEITLVISGLPGVEEQTFTWQLDAP